MVRTFISDRFHSNLIVPGPDVHPPMEIIEKINIPWGGDPPMNCDKLFENGILRPSPELKLCMRRGTSLAMNSAMSLEARRVSFERFSDLKF